MGVVEADPDTNMARDGNGNSQVGSAQDDNDIASYGLAKITATTTAAVAVENARAVEHNICVLDNTNNVQFHLTIINNNTTPFDYAALVGYLQVFGFNNPMRLKQATGAQVAYFVFGIYTDGTNIIARTPTSDIIIDPSALINATLEDILGGVALGDMTPAQIKMVADLGLAQNFFNIGDAVTIPLSAFTHPVTGAAIPAQNATFEIWGFDHDDKADGSGKAPITFGMRDLLGQNARINPTDTNTGGWNATEMRTAFMGAVLNAMPQAWRDIIAPVTKLTANNGSQNGVGAANIVPSTDSVFLFSQNEISTSTASVIAGEGSLYEFWTNRQANADRIKRMSNGAGAAAWWWWRSPLSTTTVTFRIASTTGIGGNGIASNAGGLCLGFCV